MAQWQTNPDHRTSQLLALTPAGRTKLHAITELAQQFNARISRGITKRDIDATRSVLARVLRRVDEIDSTRH